MKNVFLFIIATKKYNEFVKPLLESAYKYFMKNHNVHYFIFSDGQWSSNANNIDTIEVEHKRFPYMTLMRYRFFSDWFKETTFTDKDYIFYIDADMLFNAEIGDEILSEGLTAVVHPSFYVGGWGSPNTSMDSRAYVSPEQRTKYYCGGFQGGKATEYIKASKILASRIDADEIDATRGEWNDESMWNWYLNCEYKGALNVLTPAYCNPEDFDIPFESKIIALKKEHKLFQI